MKWEKSVNTYELIRRVIYSNIFVLRRRLHQDEWSWWRRLLKMIIFASVIRLHKTSSRSLGQDQCIRLGHTTSRRLQDIFKTSSRPPAKSSSRHLQDVLQRYLPNILKTYHQVKPFLLTSLRDVFNTFLRRTAKPVIYGRICLSHTSEKLMVSVQKLQEW